MSKKIIVATWSDEVKLPVADENNSPNVYPTDTYGPYTYRLKEVEIPEDLFQHLKQNDVFLHNDKLFARALNCDILDLLKCRQSKKKINLKSLAQLKFATKEQEEKRELEDGIRNLENLMTSKSFVRDAPAYMILSIRRQHEDLCLKLDKFVENYLL